MNIKEIIITCLITLLVCVLFVLNFIANKFILRAENVYKVYLDQDIIGYIANDQELYDLINEGQKEIKEKYNVSAVYPPEGFSVVKVNTYNVDITSAQDIYDDLAKTKSFTIDGYAINIKSDDKNITISVLDRDIFDKSIHNFIEAFIGKDEYENYINDTQPEIETTGKTIENMYFNERVTIKKGHIDANGTIYTDEPELTQYLLFGEKADIRHYKVKTGDTIESISEANKLNPAEFLIANSNYTSKDSMLKIGDTVNVTLINPVLSFAYEVEEISDAKIAFEKKVEYDSSKDVGYSEITTPGVVGIQRIKTQYKVVNGETQSEVKIIGNPVTIQEKVDQVTTKGGSRYTAPRGEYVDTGMEWGWPTNTPYVITSYFGYRWGTIHEGIDISGTGFRSPIYAVLDGTVVYAGWEGACGYGAGVCVLMEHANGYYTILGHMAEGSLTVSTGEKVARGQVIGGMGMTGAATGVHLHIGIWYGRPYKSGSKLIDPMTIYGQ